jgi:hypothetical protein
MVHLTRRRRAVAPLMLMAAMSACIPNLEVDDALVSKPEVVAVQSIPAEAAPGSAVQLTALYVTPQGAVTQAPIAWDLCAAPKPLSDPGPIAAACFGTDPSSVASLGMGLSVPAEVSSDACSLFGPDAPIAQPGQPAGRPADPDVTGGYYQPLVLHAGVATAGAIRIRCGVAGATQALSAAFVKAYAPNTNPSITSLVLGPLGFESAVPPASSSSGTVATVAAGSQNHVVVSWPDCLSSTGDCGGSEPYVVFDSAEQQIVPHREALHLSWYATGGHFSSARGGVTEAEAATTTEADNQWQAPSTPEMVTIWVVLVDDRGGSGWQTYQVQVQ